MERTAEQKTTTTELRPLALEAMLALNAPQVALLLNVSEETVQGLHRTKQLRGRMIGAHLRWRRSDVEAFVAELT